MDPDTNLREYLDAIAARDTARMMELAEALANWLEGGGFVPACCRREDRNPDL